MVQNYLNKLSTALQQKAPCEIWRKLVEHFQRRRRLKISSFYTCIQPGAVADNHGGGGGGGGGGGRGRQGGRGAGPNV